MNAQQQIPDRAKTQFLLFKTRNINNGDDVREFLARLTILVNQELRCMDQKGVDSEVRFEKQLEIPF